LELAGRLLIACTAALVACRGERGAAGDSLPVPGETGAHITVEVLNASGKPGLARIGTRVLRRAGIDVLTFGNAPEALGRLDSTRIVVRRDGSGVGKRVRAALGVGRVVLQPDSARLLDASVLLGADFAPARLDFHP
jgi:LytR cell envelope-related transcriptional attenuator